MDWRGLHRRTVIAFLILAVLLIGAGTIIYRNINKLSRLEYENQRRLLGSALFSFRRDFTGTLLDFTRAFELPIWAQTTEGLQTQLIDRYQLLLEEDVDLELVSELSLLIYLEDRPEAFFRFNSDEEVFTEEAIPVSLQDIGDSFPARSMPGRGRGVSRLNLLDEKFVIMIPQRPDRMGFRRRPGSSPPGFPRPFPPGSRANPNRRDTGGTTKGFLVLLTLDRDYLENEILSRLKESYFREPLLPGFELAITADSGEKVIYRSNEQLEIPFFSSSDASTPLVAPAGWIPPFTFAMEPELGGSPSVRQTGELNLIARHRTGSLENAIGKRRNYDLLEAFGILLLLSGAAVTLLVSVQRTRTLARRQMDFVAGISHELRNPLTAIQSAGFNLSKGTVYEKDMIRNYGQIISRESRRLTHMVEQVLSYAGIQQSAKHSDRQTLRMEEILETVLQEYVSQFEEEEWDVGVQVDEDLPSLSADPEALKSCLRNLIDNALKYANEVKSLRIEVSPKQDSGRSWVQLSVQDQGRGLSSSELPHIFDPFYRGADHVASSMPGTGLGLALVKGHVEAHGGKIQVQSSLGEGADFQLFFPAITESSAALEDQNGP